MSVTATRDLREKHFGTWEGLTDEEILRRFPQARNRPWGDGETTAALSERVLGALRRIAETHPDGHVLVVAHGGPVRAALLHCNAPLEGSIGNCHVVRIEVEEGSLRAVD